MADSLDSYRSVEGDTVDLISFSRFGDVSGMVEQILSSNPGLAELGPILPLGTIVLIPVPVTLARTTVGRLWD